MTTCTKSRTRSIAREVSHCRACGSGNLEPALDLGAVRLSAFLAPGDPDTPAVPLELVHCPACLLAQLRHDTDADTLYRRFWYRSGISATMRVALADVVLESQVRTQLASGDVVVDIASNDGTLLRCWPKNTVRIGFDPALNLKNEAREGDNCIVTEYFSADHYWLHFKKPAKVITACAVFYDVPKPNSFLRDVHSCLAHDGIFVLQLASLKGTLETCDVGNICHEHICYYPLTTLCRLLEQNGLHPFDAEENSVNGGSVRVYASRSHRPQSRNLQALLLSHARWAGGEALARFAERAKHNRDSVRNAMEYLRRRGPVYAYGASTKGNTLLQFWGLDRTDLVAAADRDPTKWSLEMSGGRVPIVSEEEARRHAKTFLVLPWHFREEMIAREEDWMLRGGTMLFPMPRVEEVDRRPHW